MHGPDIAQARVGCRSGRDCELASWRFSVTGKQSLPKNSTSRVEHPAGLPMQYHYAPCLDPWEGSRVWAELGGRPGAGSNRGYRPPDPEAARAVIAACVPPDWHAPPAMSGSWRLQWVVVFRDPARVTLTRMAEDQM